MSRQDDDQPSDDESVEETTADYGAGLLDESDVSPVSTAHARRPDVEGLPGGSALLIVKRGPNAGSRFLLDQSFTSAGRHANSDILLDDITVSRRHAEFVKLDNGEFKIIDSGSLNGTYVNRAQVESMVLANGDEIQIGKFRLVFLTRPTTG